MDSYPPPWCRLVRRRILMQIDGRLAFLEIVVVWGNPGEGFGPLKQQLLSLPSEAQGVIVGAFVDAIVGDLMTDSMPAVDIDRVELCVVHCAKYTCTSSGQLCRGHREVGGIGFRSTRGSRDSDVRSGGLDSGGSVGC